MHFVIYAFNNHVGVLHNVTPIDLLIQSAVLSDGVVIINLMAQRVLHKVTPFVQLQQMAVLFFNSFIFLYQTLFKSAVFSLQILIAFYMLWILNDAINWADCNTLWFVVITHTFGTTRRCDNVNFFTFRYCNGGTNWRA